MWDEENPDEKAYTIIKYLEDGQKIQEHNSRNYTGHVKYANNDTYSGDFKDGLSEGNGTYTYHKEEGGEETANIPNNQYQGEWLVNKKHGIGTMIYGAIGEYILEDLKMGKDTVKEFLNIKKMEMYILVLGNMELNMVMENLFLMIQKWKLLVIGKMGK